MASPIHIMVGLGAVAVASGVALAASLGLFSEPEDDNVAQETNVEVVAQAASSGVATETTPLAAAEGGEASLSAENDEDTSPSETDIPATAELSRNEKLKQFSFDVVRVEPSGDAVFAGRGPANVDLVLAYSSANDPENNKQDIAKATSSAQGDWATVSDRPLPEGTSLVWIGLTDDEGTHYADLRLLIEIGASQDDEVLIIEMIGDQTRAVIAGTDDDREEAVPQPEVQANRETKTDKPDKEAASVKAKPNPVLIDFIENDAFKLRVGGQASPEAVLRLYIDDRLQSDFVADVKGRFHQTLDLVEGEVIVVRLDHIDQEGGVLGRAETNYTIIRPEIVEKRPEPQPDKGKAKVTITDIEGNVSSGELVADQQQKTTVDSIDPEKLDGETFGYTDKGERVVVKGGKRYVEAFELTFEEIEDSKTSGQPAPTDTVKGKGDAQVAAQTGKRSEEADDSIEAANTEQDTARSELLSNTEPASTDSLSGSSVDSRADNQLSETASLDAETKSDHIEVKRGDSLWRIASSFYGEGLRYTVIFKENKQQIRDPDLIYPGQIFTIPKINRVLTPIE